MLEVNLHHSRHECIGGAEVYHLKFLTSVPYVCEWSALSPETHWERWVGLHCQGECLEEEENQLYRIKIMFFKKDLELFAQLKGKGLY